MKKNTPKYILIIIFIGLIIGIAWYMTNKEEKQIENTGEETTKEVKIENSNLRLGISNLDSLNPLLSKNQNIQDMLKFIYEPLFNITNDYKLENALGIEYSKADNKTYFIKLREDVNWHNGAEFTAEDVKYTIDIIKSLGNDSIYNANVSNIENLEIVNDNLVKIYLNEEIPLFEYNLTFPIISSNLFKDEDIRNSSNNNIPIGSGKYRLKTTDISTQIELEKNPNWWNKEKENLRIDTITVRIYGTIGELYNAYKLGGLDMITSHSSNIEDNIGTIGSELQGVRGRNFDYLALNTKSNFLSNKEVRQAITYAINKEEIINVVYGGKYFKADYPLEYGSYLYEKTNAYEYNIEKAKKILQNGGWNYVGGVWQKKQEYNTLRLRLNILVQSTNEKRVKTAEIIKKNLEEMGIPVTIISARDWTYENNIKNKNYDMLITRCYSRFKSRYEKIFWNR